MMGTDLAICVSNWYIKTNVIFPAVILHDSRDAKTQEPLN